LIQGARESINDLEENNPKLTKNKFAAKGFRVLSLVGVTTKKKKWKGAISAIA